MNNGSQYTRSDRDSLFLRHGPRNRNLGIVQIQEGVQEDFSGSDRDGPAGKPRDQPDGEHLHHDW